MNETITTEAERDALPVGSIVTDAFAATCIRARVGSGNSLFDWVRVTGAVKNGEHHHPPYLPADVERRGWSGWTSTPDAEPARTEPTEEQVAPVKALFVSAGLVDADAEDYAWDAARAVLALGLPQRCAPSEEEIAAAIAGVWGTDRIAETIVALYAAQPTVEEVVEQYRKADGVTPALRDVALERATHEQRGWTAEHDQEHGVMHLVDLTQARLDGARLWHQVNPKMLPPNYVCGELVKAASLLLAAIELLDRSGADHG